jgi:hypothetical protein
MGYRSVISARAGALLLVAACGRIDFDPIADSAVDTTTGEPPGLLLHFAFESDGLLRDRSTGHHDAVCVPSCPVPGVGRVGAGAAFDGASCLQIADAAALRPAMVTFAVWLLPATSGVQSAFGRPFNGGSAGTNTFEAFVEAPSLWKVAINTMSVNTTASTGGWHHLAGAFDGATLTMYLDGLVPAAPRVIGAASYSDGNLWIGCDVNNDLRSNFVTGMIDEVRLYDHALTANEVAQIAAPP